MNLVGKANSRRRERDLVRRFPSRLRGDVSRRFNLVNTPCHQRTRLGYIYIQMRGETIGTLCTSTRYGVKMRFLLFVFFSHMQLAVFSFLFFKNRNRRGCEEREEIPSAISPHSRRFWFDFPLRRVTMPRRSLWMRPLVSFIQEKAKKDPRGAVAHKVHVADRESSLTAYSFCRGKGRGR